MSPVAISTAMVLMCLCYLDIMGAPRTSAS